MSSKSVQWIGIDGFEPEMDQTENDVTHINSEAELEKWLRNFMDERPRMLFLESPFGSLTMIAVGGDWAGICHFAEASNCAAVYAAPAEPLLDRARYFVCEGEPDEFPGRFLIPPSLMVELMREFYRTGELPRSIAWRKRFE